MSTINDTETQLASDRAATVEFEGPKAFETVYVIVDRDLTVDRHTGLLFLSERLDSI